MTDILTKVGEIGIMSKMGGGTSGYFGDLRPRGAKISVGGESSGPVHFMELFDKVADVVSQGSARRGSFAAYLPVEHPDIEEFLQIRSEGHPIQNMSIGVTITDKWMEEMTAGDKDKRKLWGKIIQKRFETGYPYITFIDNCNNAAPQVYKDKKLQIKAQNLCVTGNQRVVSNLGLLTAKELYELNQPLILFDNKNPVSASEIKLIERDTDVYKITLENGLSHTITDYHKVATSDKLDANRQPIINDVACKDLKIGDRVAIQTEKGLFGNIHMPDEAFLLGLYQADGTQHKDTIHICVWEKDFDLLEEIQSKFDSLYKKYDGDKYINFSRSKTKTHTPKFYDSNVGFSNVKKKTLQSPFLKRCLSFEKGKVPQWIWESDEKTQ
jgi:ribonucleoside-diphosphate reductase alpha chain